jgi:iron complex outermembrane receptor protein
MQHRERCVVSVLFAFVLFASAPAFAAGAIEVRVQDPDGKPLAGALVAIAELAREAPTDDKGVCRFDGIAAGTYHLTVRRDGFLGARREVSVEGAGPASVPVTLSPQMHFSESVTVSPGGRDTFEAYQPATVLGGEELDSRIQGSLGETLGREVGVNTRSFGAAAARPVIRGLDNDRVLIIENGARTADLSSQSADHAVDLDPASAGRIEVVRGPATLLYGSSAIGGVVNVVSDEVPSRPVKGAHGAAVLQGGTANDEGGIAANLVVGNERLAFRVSGSARRTGDIDTPEGPLPNSQSDAQSGGAALAWTGRESYAGASYQYFQTEYGLPFVEENQVVLNPRRHRLDFRAERRGLDSFVNGIKVQGAFRNYRHEEKVAGEVGTAFHNRFGEGQVLLSQRPTGRLNGTLGVWGTYRDYTSEGEEALAPPTTQSSFAAFAYEELTFSHVGVQFGGRIEHNSYNPDAAAVPDREGIRDRDFTEFSGSVGLLGYLRDDVTLALNVAHAVRAPALEELYNFGPHPGNFAFEVGDPDLGAERCWCFDLSLRWRRSRFEGAITGFVNRIDDFIFPLQTGEVEDDLPVVAFTSADATLSGFEAHVDVGLTRGLWLELGGDLVRGEQRATGDPLPRIPPARGWVGLRFEKSGFHVEGRLLGADRQDRVYGFETPTAGYGLVDVHASYRFGAGQTAHTVTLRLDNAGDRLYRNHLSYIKDLAPEMGRTLKLVYAVRF